MPVRRAKEFARDMAAAADAGRAVAERLRLAGGNQVLDGIMFDAAGLRSAPAART